METALERLGTPGGKLGLQLGKISGVKALERIHDPPQGPRRKSA